ncbi:MAG: ABC transporter permease subunit [Ilumatobacteraceae bacterium]
MIATIARHQVRSLVRQRTFVSLLGVFGVMTVLAGVLGWSSHHTIVRVYDQAVILLDGQGRPAPPNPFTLRPRLSLLSNMVVYVPLIGALLALVVGHLSVVDDQSGGVGRLVFSRGLDRRTYVVGKLAAAAFVLATVATMSTVISAASLLIVERTLAPSDLARLVAFFALSWLYLMVFASIGMVSGVASRLRSLGLLSALGAWLVITFVVPQFTSGLRPTASLNPITDPVSTSQSFFRATAKLRPLSIAEQYKQASAHLLQTATTHESAVRLLGHLVPIAGALVLLAAVLIDLVGRHDYSRSASDA